MDVSSVHHGGTLLRYSVSLLGYGFYGDIIRDSEKKRWMGLIRYDFSGKSAVRVSRCVHTARLTPPARRPREASARPRGRRPRALGATLSHRLGFFPSQSWNREKLEP